MRSRFTIRQSWRSVLMLVLAFTFVLSFAVVAKACPSCKESLGTCDAAAGGADPITGYFYSILFMMSMPFAMLGTFSGYMFWQVRRARNEQAIDRVESPARGDGNHPA